MKLPIKFRNLYFFLLGSSRVLTKTAENKSNIGVQSLQADRVELNVLLSGELYLEIGRQPGQSWNFHSHLLQFWVVSVMASFWQLIMIRYVI